MRRATFNASNFVALLLLCFRLSIILVTGGINQPRRYDRVIMYRCKITTIYNTPCVMGPKTSIVLVVRQLESATYTKRTLTLPTNHRHATYTDDTLLLRYTSYPSLVRRKPDNNADYCDAFLTHDSSTVRKQHNSGFKHKANVRAYYSQFRLSDDGIKTQTQEACAR